MGSAGALGHSGSPSLEIHRRHFQLDVSGYSNSWLASIGLVLTFGTISWMSVGWLSCG